MFGRELPEFTAKALEVLEKKAGNLLEKYGFYLAGGTALTLHIKHRVSYDLDWFTSQGLNTTEFISNLVDLIPSCSNIQISYGTVHLEIEGCQISFFEYKYPLIELPKLYSAGQFKIASLNDIALMKITAIADRGVKKDFVDIYFLIKELGGLPNILNRFSDKYLKADLYHYLRALTYFEDADQMPELNMLKKVDWEEVKQIITKEVKELDFLQSKNKTNLNH